MAFADSCDHCGESYCGGNGKTPVVIWLVEQLQQRGYRVGVVSRGYGGKSAVYPLLLSDNTTTAQAGDEPVLIFQRTGHRLRCHQNGQRLSKPYCNLMR